MADDSGIDPRYAAQFQRGFDPARHAPPPQRETSRGPVRLSGGPPPTAARVPDPPPLASRAVAPPVEIDEPEVAPEEIAPRAAWTEWALLAAGGLLLAGAAWTFGLAATDIRAYTAVYDPGTQAFATVRNSLPGPLLVAGVAAITAWVVLLPGRRAG